MGVLRYALGTLAPRLGRAAAPDDLLRDQRRRHQCLRARRPGGGGRLRGRPRRRPLGVAPAGGHLPARLGRPRRARALAGRANRSGRRRLAARPRTARRPGARRDLLARPARQRRLGPGAGGDRLCDRPGDRAHRGVRRARRRGTDPHHRCRRGMGSGPPAPAARSRLGRHPRRLSTVRVAGRIFTDGSVRQNTPIARRSGSGAAGSSSSASGQIPRSYRREPRGGRMPASSGRCPRPSTSSARCSTRCSSITSRTTSANLAA